MGEAEVGFVEFLQAFDFGGELVAESLNDSMACWIQGVDGDGQVGGWAFSAGCVVEAPVEAGGEQFVVIDDRCCRKFSFAG